MAHYPVETSLSVVLSHSRTYLKMAESIINSTERRTIVGVIEMTWSSSNDVILDTCIKM